MTTHTDNGAATAPHSWVLEGRVIVVTGASSGIGAGIATYLGRAGARVVLVGRDTRRLAATAALVADGPGSAAAVDVDLRETGAAEVVVDRSLATFGGIDVLVHAAGISRFAALADSPPERLDEHYAINVRAPWALTHAALAHLQPGASIVFVSSNLAQVGQAQGTAYCASKGAIDGLTRALAVELAPRGIRVNAVSPGLIRTPMTSFVDEDPALEAELIAKTPVGRLGEVADIAPAVAFAASPISGYMVGSTILVDGGWNAH